MSKEARVRIRFEEATQESFEVFADEVAAEIPDAEVTYHDKPIFGRPYIMIRNKPDDLWEAWTLCLDEGDYLCISDNNNWVERDRV